MRIFANATKSLIVLGVLVALGACSSADDGYPRISDIKTPQPNFKTPNQQAASKGQLQRAKADHVYRKLSEVRERSRWIKPKDTE